MFQEKPLKELQDTFTTLKSKLAELDENAVRDKKLDYSLMPPNELNHILKSEIKPIEKKKILLTQIGYLRINLFAEYAERINSFEKAKNFDKAVELMNEYAVSVAIPFMSSIKKPSLMNHLMDLFSRQQLLKPSEYIQKWKIDYQSWFSQSKPKYGHINQIALFEDYLKMQTTFHMLYNLSWSNDNFPPAPLIIYYDPNKIRI